MYETITEILGFATFILIILSGIIYVVESIKDMFKGNKKWKKKKQLKFYRISCYLLGLY